jgi:hypothetical protein
VWRSYYPVSVCGCCSVQTLAAVRRLPLLENHAIAEIYPRGLLTSETGYLEVPDWMGWGRFDTVLGVDSMVGIRSVAGPPGK